MPKQPKTDEEEARPKWVNPKQQQAEVNAPKWVNPKNQQEGEEARPKWVNPKKAQGEEYRPKWVNPNRGQKQDKVVQPRSRNWVNPKWMSYRERMDKRLERAGLLNYQTQGLSQAEIAHRYAMAGISISDNSTWYKENYGADAPETITDRSKMFQYRSDVFAGKNPSIGAPGTGQAPTSGPVIAAGGKADRPQNYVKGANGLLVKAPNQPMGAVTDSPYAKQVFATNAQALKGEVNWADVSSTERTKLLNDPNFYKSGGITQYPAWMQQQILADPNFKWDNLPAWQKTYFELSASPAGMGATQGALMGVAGGPVGGAVGAALGGALGWAASKSGYDPMKEFWEQENKTAGAFGLMNWLAEQAEKTVGLAIQTVGAITNPKEVGGLDEIYGDKERLRTAWDAGSVTFEVIAPYVTDVPKMFGEVIEKTRNGMAFNDAAAEVLNSRDSGPLVTVLGSDEKVSQGYGNMFEAFAKARGEIDQGKPYREVMMELQNSVTAQIGDMVGQATADPLNFLPDMQTKVGGKIAEVGGNKVAAEAFRGSDSLVDAGRKYKTLVQSGQALTIDPNFKVDQMGRFSRFVAGINDQGQVKAGSLIGTKQGLLDPVKGKTGWLEDMTTQTPISRAQSGAGMFYDNVSAMLTMFKSPDEAIRYIKSVAKGDMESWANYGKQFAESPEFYTVLPALKDFDANVLDGMAQTWEMAAPNRDLLGRVADVMGDNPGSLLEDLARNGTAEQDFARLLKMAQESDSPNAKAILADIEAGRLNAATLKEMVDVFTGEGALPWHEGQWKAMMLDQMGSHFDEWVTKRLMLDKSPEAVSAFFRTSALLKQAQSILLLGGSPGYAITNGLSNMVHRAVSGVFGYMTGKQIDTFMDRVGMKPARLDEGVGIGGVVEQAAGSSKVQTSAMDKAVRGKGAITTAKDMLSKLSKGMPFNKVSSFFEKNEGRQAFAIGMKDFWSQSWRRGVGFREMSPELVKVMGEMGMDPQRVYAAIEAGMNQTEIEKALMGRQTEVQARGLIHDAAQKTGMTASEAATMLERTGVLDTLDKFLAGQTTREGVAGAFRRAESVAQDWMDMKMGEDLKAKAENVKQRVGLEGAAAALDVAQKAHGEFTDAWLDHYHRFGEVMQDLQMLDDPLMKDKAIDQAYNISDREFRRVFANNAANYKGIFEAWGMSGDVKALKVLESIGEVDGAMAGAYRAMRENIRAWREAWAGDLKNPQRWDEWNKVQAKNEAAFKQGFKAKHEAEVKQGAALGEIYESLYGPAAGEAARLWWEDVVEFGDEITRQENEFRQGVKDARAAGVPAEDIAAEKQKYYSEKKPIMIAELEKINNEGIARLERVIRGGSVDDGGVAVDGGPKPGGPATEVTGSQVEGQRSQVEGQVSSETPSPSRVDRVEELNALMAAAEQRKGRDAAEAEGRKAAVWDVAEEYWGKGGNYNRGILQDGFALVAALKKPEYGGIPDLKWLDDPRLTPELARQILENRKAVKEAAGVEAAAKVISEKPKGRGVKAENLNLLQAIQRHGGLNLEVAKDLMGEKKPKSAPGVWQKKGFNKGWDMSDMARFLADDGYPIDLNHPNDPGGVGQATELLRRALVDKEKIYPMGHDFDAELAKAEAAYYAEIDGTFPEGSVFDAALWQSEFDTAVRGTDLGRVYELIGDVPEEQLSVIRSFDYGGDLASAQDGVTWRDYLSRTADEVAARANEDATMERVAGKAAESEQVLADAEYHAEAVTKRAMVLEGMAEAFGLNEKETSAYGEMNDAVAEWYARQTGEGVDDFYNRYFGEARRSVDGGELGVDGEGLMQQAPSTTAKSASAQDGEHIPGTFDKGMVTFEGVKGTITAFEAADFSTVIHETGHIYRRMLKDVAERTNNPYILRDLTTIEEWAGVKDGAWNRDAEEKFARGFERYVTEGNAPTPKLKAAFESFRTWMLEIYKTITGSSIDVKLTDEVRRAFDRMLGAENLRLDLDNQLKQMNYDPKLWYVDPLGNIVKRPEFKLEIDQGKAARDVAAMDIEGMRARVEALRQRAAAGEIKPGPGRDISRTSWTTDQPELVKQIRDERNPANWRSWASVEEAPVGRESVRALTDWTLGKMREGRGSQVEGPLFQSESIPFGMYDEQSGFRASGDGLDALWREKVSPLLRAMEEEAQLTVSGGRLTAGEGAARDVSPEGPSTSLRSAQDMLRRYMEQVKGDMATTKLATVRYAEKTRDFALLNYSKRYGFDRYADAVMPYQFYASRSGVNWAARMLDKPALYSNYARLRMQQERYERDIPERMRGKIKINAPWLPEWAGDGLYIDPMRNLFFPDTIMRSFERKQQDKNYQVIEAERVLQEWQSGGQYSDQEIIEAAKTQQGKVWDRAWAEAQIRRESDTANPVDFFTSFFGPAWYLSTPLNLAGVKVPGISKGDPNKVNATPLGNTARALDTVTQGTWAEPFGDLVGLIGKAEDKAREAFKLPTRGEYAEYYTKRQVANMVAEGKITSEQAQIAMIEKSGPYWDEAKQRVDMELALRVPLAGVTYAALHGGPKAAAQAAVPSLFGAGLLPAGELEFRGLKQEWNEAWKLADAGDTQAVSRFFDNHPEYEAYLAKNKDDGELLKSFLIGSVWDAYMEMGETNQKMARAELGEAFQQSFLDKETRSYDTLTTEQLAAWTQLLGKYVPTPAGQVPGVPSTTAANASTQDKMRLYPEAVTGITDQYFEQRREKFPNYYEEQAGYYALPKSERKGYLREHPNLKAYWDWKSSWYDTYPEYVPIFNGNAFDRVDTSGWMPGLEESVREAAMAGGSLPDGARAALMNEWILGGQPMGNFDTWVTSVVMPGMLYGSGE